MPDPETVRLVLEVERRQPLSGRIGREGEDPKSFAGWTALAAALESLIAKREEGPRGRGPSPNLR